MTLDRVLPPTARSSKWSLAFRFSTTTSKAFLVFVVLLLFAYIVVSSVYAFRAKETLELNKYSAFHLKAGIININSNSATKKTKIFKTRTSKCDCNIPVATCPSVPRNGGTHVGQQRRVTRACNVSRLPTSLTIE